MNKDIVQNISCSVNYRMMSTATKLSKFGVPLTEETKDRVLDLYKMYSWLNGIHFHVGSQGVPIQLFVDGARVSCVIVLQILLKLLKVQMELNKNTWVKEKVCTMYVLSWYSSFPVYSNGQAMY